MAYAGETFGWDRAFQPFMRALDGVDPTDGDPLALFDDTPGTIRPFTQRGQLGGDEIRAHVEAAGRDDPEPLNIVLPKTTRRDDHQADRWAAERGVRFDQPGGSGRVIDFAQSVLGRPYVWAQEDPKIGFDCSGLVYWAFNRAGFNIPRTTARGYQNIFKYVGRDDLQAGDVVYFSYGRLGRGVVDHIGIYIGNGQMIDASSSNNAIVKRGVDWDNLVGGGRLQGMKAAPAEFKPPKAEKPKVTKKRVPVFDEDVSVAVLGLAGGIAESFTQPTGATTRILQRVSQPGAPDDLPKGGSPEENMQLGQALAQDFGWSGKEWNALKTLWMRESGWQTDAANPTSSARGIPQAMMNVHFGTNWEHNPKARRYLNDPRMQILWGLRYIADRYGSPVAALAHSNRYHWY